MFGPSYPGLAFSVQGLYWHYGGGGARSRSESVARDILTRTELAGQGITLIFLDEDDIQRDVRYYVGEGLLYRDHSRLSE